MDYRQCPIFSVYVPSQEVLLVMVQKDNLSLMEYHFRSKKWKQRFSYSVMEESVFGGAMDELDFGVGDIMQSVLTKDELYAIIVHKYCSGERNTDRIWIIKIDIKYGIDFEFGKSKVILPKGKSGMTREIMLSDDNNILCECVITMKINPVVLISNVMNNSSIITSHLK